MSDVRAIRCPICETALRPPRQADHPHFPFCSRRCKLVDLGRWLDGNYRVSEPVDDSPDEPDDNGSEPTE